MSFGLFRHLSFPIREANLGLFGSNVAFSGDANLALFDGFLVFGTIGTTGKAFCTPCTDANFRSLPMGRYIR